ncbi:hypothetical protein AKJ57_04555 [candidate division MSBL1 archaeon SCGC-AAA259A05]|uniref:Uncharacterized protein n=1 Tax=candidate division MSBL1 archaeon SCGC-AAA259A05 TaxID=1698259 RepID=A0A133U754_9EURY|nr:hypothetical protein AKJ57_04555 [candidate division MSBL1 archaeon SCGC-AAA259A05]
MNEKLRKILDIGSKIAVIVTGLLSLINYLGETPEFLISLTEIKISIIYLMFIVILVLIFYHYFQKKGRTKESPISTGGKRPQGLTEIIGRRREKEKLGDTLNSNRNMDQVSKKLMPKFLLQFQRKTEELLKILRYSSM